MIYFISGANRGIGLALVAEIVSKHRHAIVYAGVRDVDRAICLKELGARHPGQVQIVRYVSADVKGNNAIADEIRSVQGHVDVVIANAAMSHFIGPVSDTPADQLREHFDVNVAGVLILFQTMYSLLKLSKNPKFIPITSAAASLTAYMDIGIGYTCYGVSKVALNWLARKIHFENHWLVCFPLSPGVVETDMMQDNVQMDKSGALAALRDANEIPVDTAARGMVEIINNATRESRGGAFVNVDGKIISW